MFVYKIFKVDDLLKNNEINQYVDQLIGLIKICAEFDLTHNMFIHFLNMHSMILIAFDDLKIIGTLYVKNEEVIRLDDHKSAIIKPYVLQRSFTGIRDHFMKNTHHLFPMICNFCRIPDNLYKGVGRSMLQKIIKRCKKDGYKKIYCVPESIIELTDKTRDDKTCGMNSDYDNENNLYYKSNIRLIRYYQKLGFNIYDNHYVVDFCSDKTIDSDYISFHVLYMDI